MSENKKFDILSGSRIMFTGSPVRVYAWLKDSLPITGENYDVMEHGSTVRVDGRTFVREFEEKTEAESIESVMAKLALDMDRHIAVRKLVGMAMVSAVRIQSSDADRALKHIALGKKLEEITQKILEVFAENEEKTGE